MPQTLRFTKMHGLGNDFVVVDRINQRFDISPTDVRRLSDRHRGVGFDQMLLVEESIHPENDFRYRVFNADGSEIGQCGNGARCFARYVYDRGLTHKKSMRVETLSGLLRLQIRDDQVAVEMGIPSFEALLIPMDTSKVRLVEEQSARSPGQYQLHSLVFDAVSIGNPHAVIWVNKSACLAQMDVAATAKKLQGSSAFPESVNVGFCTVTNRKNIQLRVYERGSGETLACGSGACAAVACARHRFGADNVVQVSLTGGVLTIQWDGEGRPITMIGPASYVYEGTVTL